MATLKLGTLGRRDVLRAGMCGLALGVVGWGAAPSLGSAAEAAKGRILVVVELSGANDGLNTVVPYSDDAYYRARPKLGIRADKLRKLDDLFALQATMAGFERLYKDGNLAIVHGIGYDQPSFSHFTSMAYWHVGAPNSGDAFGWLGRLADAMIRAAPPISWWTSRTTSPWRCGRATMCLWCSIIPKNLRAGGYSRSKALSPSWLRGAPPATPPRPFCSMSRQAGARRGSCARRLRSLPHPR